MNKTIPNLTIRSEQEGDRYLIEVSGELDLATVGELKRELHRARASESTRIELEFSGVEFIDSSGIGALLAAGLGSDRLQLNGELQDQVERTLALVGVLPAEL